MLKQDKVVVTRGKTKAFCSVFIFLVLNISHLSCQTQQSSSLYDESCKKVFENFVVYLRTLESMKEQSALVDTAVKSFLAINSDSVFTANTVKTAFAVNQIAELKSWVRETRSDDSIVFKRPGSGSNQGEIYKHLSKYAQDNIFVVSRVSDPSSYFYVLFVPQEYIRSSAPKILSWTVGFRFGKAYFVDLVGMDGPDVLLNTFGKPHP